MKEYPNEGIQIQTKQIESKLLKHYGSNNIVFQDQYDRKMSQLVYSSKIALNDVINAVARQNSAAPCSSKEDGTDVGVQDACATLFHAANIIREDIKKCKGISIKPLNATDITESKAKELLPNSVFNFLYWVIQGTSDNQPDALTLAEKQETKSNQHQRQILSIGQDLVYAVSKGKIRTPKHVGYSVTVKHKTNSEQLVTLANHAGHGIGYKEAVRIEEAFINQNKKGLALGLCIPNNIVPGGGFIHGAGDNMDFAKETLDGKRTTHATSMVLYQNSQHEHASDVKSLDVPQIPVFTGSEKHPVPVFENDVELHLFDIKTDIISEKVKDITWMLKRLDADHVCDANPSRLVKEQFVPGWTPYNVELSKADATLTTIGCCSPLPDPPTDDSTVYKMMSNFLIMSKKLGQNKFVLTLDLAIYKRAKVLQWNFDIFKDLIIRLGGFHIILNFIGCIGNLYMASRLEEWLIDGDVYGPNTLAKILAGKQYNRVIRACKILLEALFCSKWVSFCQWVKRGNRASEREMELFSTNLKQFELVMQSGNKGKDSEALSEKKEIFHFVQELMLRVHYSDEAKMSHISLLGQSHLYASINFKIS